MHKPERTSQTHAQVKWSEGSIVGFIGNRYLLSTGLIMQFIPTFFIKGQLFNSYKINTVLIIQNKFDYANHNHTNQQSSQEKSIQMSQLTALVAYFCIRNGRGAFKWAIQIRFA